MKIIPLHSLIITSSEYESKFDSREITSLNLLQYSLVGNRQNSYVNDVLYDELIRTIKLKISLGERVVLIADGIIMEQIHHIIKFTKNMGASVFYYEYGTDTQAELILGDFTLAYPMDLKNYNGITVIGDIHGMYQSMLNAMSWARSRKHFIIFLGDFIDYGYETLEVTSEIYRLVTRGEAITMIGNHEKKIIKWLAANEVNTKKPRLSEGNKVTIDALMSLDEISRVKWINRFKTILGYSSSILDLNNIILSHAAFHPSLWTDDKDDHMIERYALYGEGENRDGSFYSTFKWIDNIPKDKIGIVGHDIRAKEPRIITNNNGGKVVFLDTGCGKGGSLSSCDLKLENGVYKVENLNLY